VIASISSDKPQIVEYFIGSRVLRLFVDPLLHQRQPVGSLMDIVAVGNVMERLKDLLETVGSCRKRALRRFSGRPLKIILDGPRQIQSPGISHLSPSGTPDFTENGAPGMPQVCDVNG
jgi:hypothetical protein